MTYKNTRTNNNYNNNTNIDNTTIYQFTYFSRNFRHSNTKIMATHSKKEISIDLFNLLPLPDERNAMDSYLDIPNNYYIPDGRNSRLMNITNRNVFDRQMVNGNEGFVLEIPFLEGAFSTKHFIVDKVNGQMAGIYDDMVEVIKCQAQMEPFNLKQLNTMVATLEQKRQGLMFLQLQILAKLPSRQINRI